MRSDLLAEAEEAAARAAKAADVAIRGLDTLAELEAMIALFDEIWEPDSGNSSLRLDLLRALTKAGNYAAGAYDLASGELLGACIGFFGPPAHAELHSHIAGVRPAGLGRSVGFALNDFSSLRYLQRLNAEQPDGGQRIDLIPDLEDPKDLYTGLAKESGRVRRRRAA